VSEGMSV